MSEVTLISYSKGTGIFEDYDLTELISYCARVSNPSNQRNTYTSKKLLNYLIKHQHWSPFEMVNVCLCIKTSRDIGRQILRHRSFSFQEFSQRYAQPDFVDVYDLREARLQDHKNRQNSIELTESQRRLNEDFRMKQVVLMTQAKQLYEWAIKKGIAKECARAVLPEGMMNSVMYMNGTLRSWIHYINLRTENGTQKEHMEIAEMCRDVLASIFPMIIRENK